MQITVKETEMLKAFVNEAQLQTGATTAEEVLEDNMSFMNAVDLLQEVGGSLQSVGGVMASLAAKGFIVDTGESTRGASCTDWSATSDGIRFHFSPED